MKKQLFTAFALLGAIVASSFAAFAQDAPKQALREVPFVDVKLDDSYWAPRIRTKNCRRKPTNGSITSGKRSRTTGT